MVFVFGGLLTNRILYTEILELECRSGIGSVRGVFTAIGWTQLQLN